MNLYFIARIVLAGALIHLWRAEIPRELRWYLQFMTVYLLLPQDLYSERYAWSVWVPLEIVQAVLAAIVWRHLFVLMSHRKTFWWERVNLILFGLCIAGILVAATWLWVPVKPLQVIVVLRQYYMLALFALWGVVMICLTRVRPIHLEPATHALGLFWLLWLGCQFAMSTTGGGCLLFHVIGRSGNAHVYWGIGVASMTIRAGGAVWCRRKIR